MKACLSDEKNVKLSRALRSVPFMIKPIDLLSMEFLASGKLIVRSKGCTICEDPGLDDIVSTHTLVYLKTKSTYTVQSDHCPVTSGTLNSESASSLALWHRKLSESTVDLDHQMEAMKLDVQHILNNVYSGSEILEFRPQSDHMGFSVVLQSDCVFCQSSSVALHGSITADGFRFKCSHCNCEDPSGMRRYPIDRFLKIQPSRSFSQFIGQVNFQYVHNQYSGVPENDKVKSTAHLADPTPYLSDIGPDAARLFKEYLTNSTGDAELLDFIVFVFGETWIHDRERPGNWYHFNGVVWEWSTGNSELNNTILDYLKQVFKRALDWYSNQEGRDLPHATATVSHLERMKQKMVDSGFVGHLVNGGCSNSLSVKYNEFMSKCNKDPYIHVTRDGTLDLTTMTFRPSRPNDYFTLWSNAYFNDQNTAEVLKAMDHLTDIIRTIFTDPAQFDWNMRYFASLLDGSNDEQFLVLGIGDSSNGKSLIIKILRMTLGSAYTKMLPSSYLFTSSNSSSTATPEVASISNARFVYVSELERKGNRPRPLNTMRIKNLVGGDEVGFRDVYQGHSSKELRIKFMIMCNPEDIDLAHLTKYDAVYRRVVFNPYRSKFAMNQDQYRAYQQKYPGAPVFMKDETLGRVNKRKDEDQVLGMSFISF
ncbi:uncharacterized protein BJ171DRAFT_593312 [Polychytrium aggregatum]|uniref:uncharacterized protein n=1 Tax=Polychytrium aggregatum TaxID=110093 RepID=UPI0022FF29B0|nr:uncharacterized protein BJ171DRAFT_593312 [Polychytrium aggregatum]KAI9188485.1 hypothetical protein BJ171DRAFT_593312 [Polychytrium aggregatum]